MIGNSAKVQDNISSDALQAFARPVGVAMITQSQDWKTRQKTQYESMKGYMKEDFLGLKDWGEQIEMYSRTNIMILYKAFLLIRALVGRNRNVLLQLFRHPQLGWVGKFMMKIYGFDKVFTAPAEILNNNDALKQRFGL